MKSKWSIKRLSEVAEIQMGQSPKGSSYNISGEGVPLINGPVEFGETPFSRTKRTKFTTEPTKMCRAGDLILCVRGSTTGRMNIAGYDSCIGRGVASIRSEKYQDWINFFIHVNRETIYRLGSGATFPNVSGSMLAKLEIPIPPESEQKRIVAIMDEAFEGIDRAIANAEKNLANARELFESYLNAVFNQKGKGWVEKKLGDIELIQIIDGDRGTNYPQQSDFSNAGHCLFLNTKNVRPDGFNFDTTMFITEEKDNLLRKGKLKRRDVILTTRGTIGNIAIYDDSVEFEHIRINSGMLIFRPNENIIKSEYLFEILRSSIMKSQIEKFTSGAAQPQLPIKTLVSFSFPVPISLEEQSRIVSNLHELYTETQRLETIYRQKIAALNELKQSILQKAFTGELTADTANQTTKAANEGIAA